MPSDLPQEAVDKIDKLEEQVVKFNQDMKTKNEKLIELLTELEEVKVQVHARDKSIELQQQQIAELLEELREAKGLENDVKLLIQKKMALSNENEKLREELNKNLIEGADAEEGQGGSKSEVEELMQINNMLNEQI